MMKIKKLIILLSLFCLHQRIYAQQNVGIGTNTPNASALLDIRSSNKGLLIPRVNLLSETDVVTIVNPANSLLIFNTNNALPDGEGYYFWNGTKWSKFATRTTLANLAWGITGNAGINPNTDFIGTTDNRPLIFKTNNILSGKIEPGPNNVFFGQSAGLANTTGINNTFIGHLAGRENTTGNENVFIGEEAGRNNTTGSDNVFIGEDAGLENIGGDDNVFIGNGAGRNSLGSENCAVGNDAMSSNIIGSFNAVFGYKALSGINFGSRNAVFGYQAMAANESGQENAAFGYQVLSSNITGSSNAAFGNAALLNNSFGSLNAAFGADALRENTIGFKNTACGNSALRNNVSGDLNTALGHNSGPSASDLTNTTAVGFNATVSTSNTMVFGDGAVDRWAFGLTTTGTQHALEVGDNFFNGNGAFLTIGGVWTNASSKIKKEDFSAIDGSDLLKKIMQMPVQRWKYKGTNEYHIGPVAEDFYKLFGLGTDDKGISTIDPSGIALAAIQELQKIIEKQNELIQQLQKRVELLEKK